MADLKEKLAGISTAGITGMVVIGIIQLNIFATKADISDQKAFLAQNYLTKQEVKETMNDLRFAVEKLSNKLDDIQDKGK